MPNRGFLGQSGAYRCFPVPWTPAIPHHAAAQLRCCARCSPLYWLLPAKTQLPPYGGLREFELKCLRSHPTLLRFYPQTLSGAPVLSLPLSCSFRFFPKKSKALLILDSSIYLGHHNTCFLIATILRKFAKQNGLSKRFYHLLDTSSSYSPEHSAAIWNAASSGKSGSKSSGSSSGSASQRSALE